MMKNKFELIPGKEEDYEEISNKNFDCGVRCPTYCSFFDEDFPESLKIKMMELTDAKTKLQKIAPEFTDEVLDLLWNYFCERMNQTTMNYSQLMDEIKKDKKFDGLVSKIGESIIRPHKEV